jgi:hypothetical protein
MSHFAFDQIEDHQIKSDSSMEIPSPRSNESPSFLMSSQSACSPKGEGYTKLASPNPYDHSVVKNINYSTPINNKKAMAKSLVQNN